MSKTLLTLIVISSLLANRTASALDINVELLNEQKTLMGEVEI